MHYDTAVRQDAKTLISPYQAVVTCARCGYHKAPEELWNLFDATGQTYSETVCVTCIPYEAWVARAEIVRQDDALDVLRLLLDEATGRHPADYCRLHIQRIVEKRVREDELISLRHGVAALRAMNTGMEFADTERQCRTLNREEAEAVLAAA